MNKKIYVYTTKDCPFCKDIKTTLKDNNIKFIEREKSNFNKEWQEIVALTRMPVFPTINIGSECLIPNRDFSSPEQLVDVVNYTMKQGNKWSKEDRILEMLKSMNHGIAIYFNKDKNK